MTIRRRFILEAAFLCLDEQSSDVRHHAEHVPHDVALERHKRMKEQSDD